MSRSTLYDPLQAAFSMGQELYKAGLLSTVNQRRFVKGASAVGWPAVGATETEEVWREGGARLLRYRAGAYGANASRPPLLLVCSLINRPYILDLLPERSVVQRLLGAGLDVWLLDWGTPRAADAELSLGDYALGRLPRAVDATCSATGRNAVHVLGYCMGGTFALMALGADRLRAASLIALAAPVDFHDRGMLSTWCRSPGFDGESLARTYGNVPPHLLQPAFKMLDPISIATKLIHLDEKIEDDDFLRFFLAMETWLEDSVAFPGGAFAEWVAAYRDNSLARGTLELDGEPVDLKRVRCPIFTAVAESDYITPPESSLAIERLADSCEHEVARMKGGHIGLSTGRAAHESLWPRVAAWIKERDRATRQHAAGSAPAKRGTNPAPTRARTTKSRSSRKSTGSFRGRDTQPELVREGARRLELINERAAKSPSFRNRSTRSDSLSNRTIKSPSPDADSTKSVALSEHGPTPMSLRKRSTKSPSLGEQATKAPSISESTAKSPALKKHTTKAPAPGQSTVMSPRRVERATKPLSLSKRTAKSPAVREGTEEPPAPKRGGAGR